MSQIDRYLTDLRQSARHADNSLRAIERDLRQLAALLSLPASSRKGRSLRLNASIASEPDWQGIDADILRNRLSRLRSGGLSAATLARMASSWRGFFEYLVRSNCVGVNPMAGLRTPKKAPRLPKALSPDQAMMLVNTDPDPDLNPDPELRAAAAPLSASDLMLVQALTELLYGTGLRIAECIGLDVSAQAFDARCGNGVALGGWIDWPASNVHVMGKGGRSRIVPMGEPANQRVRSWLAVRTERLSVNATLDASVALFLGPRGQRLSVRSAQRLLERWAIIRGVGQHVHPHMLRHSFASHVLQSSGDLRAVQELMGHASIASTQVYTALDFQRLSAVYDQAHPKARRRPNS